jgi:endo-1,4-beta-xylanase
MKESQDNKRFKLILLISAALLLIGGVVMSQFEKKEQPQLITQKEPIEKGINLLDGNWKYMAGVERTDKGLSVSPIQRTIVEQDGSVQQKNPPINLVGTYIDNLNGDFKVSATVDLQQSTSATLQFYTALPVIADEFRIERQSISLAVTSKSLIVKSWNGTLQGPSEVRTFTYPETNNPKISMARKNKKIVFTVNDSVVGKIPQQDIFSSKKMWFGLEAENKQWLLTSLRIEGLNDGKLTVADGATLQIDKRDSKGLQELVSKDRKNFRIGTAVASNPLVSDSDYTKAAFTNFRSVTPENEMKMINLQPQRGVYTFAQADGLVRLATQNGLTVHGHTLVFGEANPQWFNSLPAKTTADKQKIESIMKEHIQTVVSHYGTDVLSWDVINEPMADYNVFTNTKPLRNHKWYQAMGEEYIVKALVTAHQANPNALLFINEYGLEEDSSRWRAFVSLLERIKPQLEEHGVPLEKVAVGFQSHVYEREDRINPEILRRHIQQLEKMGFKTQISEMDVYSDDGDKVQSEQYVDVLRVCLEEKNCIAYRIWILSDRYNFWKDEKGNIHNGKDGLFAVNMQPRPAYDAFIRTFGN